MPDVHEKHDPRGCLSVVSFPPRPYTKTWIEITFLCKFGVGGIYYKLCFKGTVHAIRPPQIILWLLSVPLDENSQS